MQPRALLLVSEGPSAPARVVELAHGDLVGRLPHCRLQLKDPRVSEAHALVSLRGDALRLLALRGRIVVDGVAQSDVALAAGQRIVFAGAGSVEVVDVVLPDAVIAVEGDGVPLQTLLGTTSVVREPAGLTLRASALPDAAGVFVFDCDSDSDSGSGGDDGGHWWFVRGAVRTRVVPEVPIEVEGLLLWPRLVPLLTAGAAPTSMPLSEAPLKIVARYQSVHIFRGEHAAPVVVDGVGAQIVSELIALGGPTAWDVVAREVWRDDTPLALLRGRWDAQVSRLRARLRSGGVRPDLIRSDRHGFVELVLGANDAVVDEL